MRASRIRPLFRCSTLALAVATAAACGSEVVIDPNDREVAWSYGPTQGGATQEHLLGSGTQGDGAVAKGWQCRLVDKKRLTIGPFTLAKSHPLFGNAVLVVGVFDQSGTQLASLRSGTLTADHASFEFDLDADVAAKLWDVVLWYAKP